MLRSGRPLENPLCPGPIPSEYPRPEAVSRVEGSEEVRIAPRPEDRGFLRRGVKEPEGVHPDWFIIRFSKE